MAGVLGLAAPVGIGLWHINLATGAEEKLSDLQFRRGEWALPSPDAKKLLYQEVAYPAPGPLWVMNIDGSGRHAFQIGRRGLGTWAPDSSRFAYWGSPGTLAAQSGLLHIVTLTEGGPEDVIASSETSVQLRDSGPVAWSPSGEALAIAHLYQEAGAVEDL